MRASTQRALSQEQIEAFYHDEFVDSQVGNYLALVPTLVPRPRAVVDVGGGCGFFAEGLRHAAGIADRVIDLDPTSVATCQEKGVEAAVGDALHPQVRGDEDVVCFNLILHHLVGSSEARTLALQKQALANWHGRAQAVFVDEYIYDSYFSDLSGRLIYEITSSKRLSALAKAVSRLVPSLRANTFGVGVRFRSCEEWRKLFESLGYHVAARVQGPEEHVSIARRLLLIRSCRRDSFLLTTANTSHQIQQEALQ